MLCLIEAQYCHPAMHPP